MDVAEEEDAFQGVVTASLSVLVLGVETRLDAALLQMTRLPWASLESVPPPATARAPVRALSPCWGGDGCGIIRLEDWQAQGVEGSCRVIGLHQWQPELLLMGEAARAGGRPVGLRDRVQPGAGGRGPGGGRRAVAAPLPLLLRQAGRLLLPPRLRDYLPVRALRPAFRLPCPHPGCTQPACNCTLSDHWLWRLGCPD